MTVHAPQPLYNERVYRYARHGAARDTQQGEEDTETGFSEESSSRSDQPRCSDTQPKRMKCQNDHPHAWTVVLVRGHTTLSATGAHDFISSAQPVEQECLLGVVECTPDTFCTQGQVCDTCAYCIAHRIGNRSSTGRNRRFADTTCAKRPEG